MNAIRASLENLEALEGRGHDLVNPSQTLGDATRELTKAIAQQLLRNNPAKPKAAAAKAKKKPAAVATKAKR